MYTCITITKAQGQGYVDRIMATRPFLVDISHETYYRRTKYSVCTIYALKKNAGCLNVEPCVRGGRCEQSVQFCIFQLERDHKNHQLGVLHDLSSTILSGIEL